MRRPGTKQFTGNGSSVIRIEHEPIIDAGRRTERFDLAVIDGGDLDSSHIPTEAVSGYPHGLGAE